MPRQSRHDSGFTPPLNEAGEEEPSFTTQGDDLIPTETDNIPTTPPKPVGGRNETLPGTLQEVEQRAQQWDEQADPLGELLRAGDDEYGIDLRTDLNDVQIIQFSRARIMADQFHIRSLAEFVEHIERLSVSHQRKGRKEFVEAYKSANGNLNGTMPVGQSVAEKLRG